VRHQNLTCELREPSCYRTL